MKSIPTNVAITIISWMNADVPSPDVSGRVVVVAGGLTVMKVPPPPEPRTRVVDVVAIRLLLLELLLELEVRILPKSGLSQRLVLLLSAELLE